MEHGVEDRVLEERVRSEIGRKLSTGADVEVAAEHGRVTLSGAVPAKDLQKVVRTARSVRGVEGVENRLEAERSDGGSVR
ncbi:MAG: BON domain-containing protein [Longimicrobiales bacterium]